MKESEWLSVRTEVWEKKPSGEFVRMEEIPIVKHEEWTDANGRNNLLRINGAGATGDSDKNYPKWVISG